MLVNAIQKPHRPSSTHSEATAPGSQNARVRTLSCSCARRVRFRRRRVDPAARKGHCALLHDAGLPGLRSVSAPEFGPVLLATENLHLR